MSGNKSSSSSSSYSSVGGCSSSSSQQHEEESGLLLKPGDREQSHHSGGANNRYYNSMSSSPISTSVGFNENRSTDDSSSGAYRLDDIVDYLIVNFKKHLICAIVLWCISINMAIYAAHIYDVSIHNHHTLYLHWSVIFSLSGVVLMLCFLCISTRKLCSVEIIPVARLEYLKSHRAEIPLNYVTLKRLSTIRALVFLFLTLALFLSIISVSLLMLYKWYSGSIGRLWLALCPMYICCFVLLTYMILVKGFKIAQIVIFLLGVIESVRDIHIIIYIFRSIYYQFDS
jgi:hypothetical protein